MTIISQDDKREGRVLVLGDPRQLLMIGITHRLYSALTSIISLVYVRCSFPSRGDMSVVRSCNSDRLR